MKLLRFKVNTPKGFRSLQSGFEIYFLRDFDYHLAHDFNPNILAGRNGSGKSNILEALANIFYHLDCMFNDYLPDGFIISEEDKTGFDNKVCVVDAFELEYLIDIPATIAYRTYRDVTDFPNNMMQVQIRITKLIDSAPTLEWVNMPNDNDREIIFDKKLHQLFLPKYVLGYSSGENELLSLPFFKTRFLHYDEYAEKLIKRDFFGNPPQTEGRLVFLDKEYTQAILLANFLMQDEAMLLPFKEEVELEDIDQFRLIINLKTCLTLHEDVLLSRKLTIDQLHEENIDKIQLTENLNDSIDRLKKCSTCFQIEYDEVNGGREFLTLDYKVTPETKKAFKLHFGNNPLQLFQLFQILLELNAHVVSEEDKKKVYRSKSIFINHDIYPYPLEEDRILRFKNLWIKKESISNPLLTKELSDGEHQFLHTLGLCLLFKNESCLFLLDEPETHFNPDWKAKFISSVRHCFDLEDSTKMREMLITTHSPYLVSDSESKYVHVFVKDNERKKVTCGFPEFQTLGTSVNKITLRIFNKPDTIGAFANSKIEELRKELEETKDKEVFLTKVRKEIGESVESMLFINDIIDQIESK